MKQNRKQKNRSTRVVIDRPCAYNVPAMMPSAPYAFNVRMVFQLTATAIGPFSFSPTPKDLADYALDQFLSGIVKETVVTAASGEILVTPVNTVRPRFIRVKLIDAWGPTGGQVSSQHNIITGDQLVIATPKRLDEAAGVSDKPYSCLRFQKTNDMAYSTSNAVAFAITRFSGYTAIDPTVILDYHIVLFS